MNNEPLVPDSCEKPAQIDLTAKVLKEGVKLAYALPLVLASIQASGAATLSHPVGGTPPVGPATGAAPRPPPGGPIRKYDHPRRLLPGRNLPSGRRLTGSLQPRATGYGILTERRSLP